MIPVETVIHERQQEYYDSLEVCDKKGNSTLFVSFGLNAIKGALEAFLSKHKPVALSPQDRLYAARDYFVRRSFTRRDYQKLFPILSTATASRDLALGVVGGHLKKQGAKALTRYIFS